MKKNCAFQCYCRGTMVEDTGLITLDEAKALFNKHYRRMVDACEDDAPVEVAIWTDMAHESDYHATLIHLHNPEVKDGVMVETTVTRYPKFN